MPSIVRAAAGSLFLAAFVSARAELPILAKARAYLGSESALNSVKALHMTGSFVTPDPTDAKKMTFVSLDIIVQAPYQQRVTSSSDRSVEITGLDGYDAWHRRQNPKNPSQHVDQVENPAAVHQLRASVLENLAYYRMEKEGVKASDGGEASVDGVRCEKVSFTHPGDIVFTRYFDVATGRLVLTEKDGTEFREEGETTVNGIRFPKSLSISTRGRDGKRVITKWNFDHVTLNETFPASTFAMPLSTR